MAQSDRTIGESLIALMLALSAALLWMMAGASALLGDRNPNAAVEFVSTTGLLLGAAYAYIAWAVVRRWRGRFPGAILLLILTSVCATALLGGTERMALGSLLTVVLCFAANLAAVMFLWVAARDHPTAQ